MQAGLRFGTHGHEPVIPLLLLANPGEFQSAMHVLTLRLPFGGATRTFLFSHEPNLAH